MTSSIDTSPDNETRPSFMETLAVPHVSAINELIEKMLGDKVEVALYDVASDAWSSDEKMRELYSFLANYVKSLGFVCYQADGTNRVELPSQNGHGVVLRQTMRIGIHIPSHVFESLGN